MKPTAAFSPFCTCGFCGRRNFLVTGLYAGAGLLLSRPLLRAAEALALPTGTPDPIADAVPLAARPLPLADVRLTGGPLKRAQELGMQNLLRLDPDRLMYRFRERAGLPPKADDGYGSWEGPGRQLTGHMAGHYLSAVSYMYAATGDQRFKDLADRMVNEFKEVQDKQGDGYVGALMGTLPRNQEITDGKTVLGGKTYPVFQFRSGAGRNGQPTYIQVVDGKPLFEQITAGDIRSGGFDLNGMWSPWYVQHKIFAGLRDAYRQTGNRTALDVSTKFAAWVESIVGNLNDAQTQRMLATEFGGMNEVLADLYADTGDKRWLALSEKFHHRAIVDPLANGQDILAGKHGNTQVPKLLGELVRYNHAGNAPDGDAAKFFWDAVVYHHSFATGGHGYDEGFGPADRLNGQVDGTGQRNADMRTCESCNVYNMIKLSRLLFALDPQDKFAEFHERALFNHILASMDLESGQVSYMVPVGQGVAHEYQGELGMTCCCGTGLESPGLDAYGIYYESDGKFWVNLYAPSTAKWEKEGVNFTMDTSFPAGGDATLKVSTPSPKEFTVALRRPSWAGDGFVAKVNGGLVGAVPKPGEYLELKRTWKDGDTVSLTLPKSLWKDPLPDNPNRVALMWGPLVLGADLGQAGLRARYPLNPRPSYPVFVAKADAKISDWLKPAPTAERPNQFHATGQGGAENEVDFLPFYQLSQRRYGIYWDVYTPEEFVQREAQADPAAEARRKLEAATVAYIQPGQMQTERDFNFQGEEASVIAGDTPGRWTRKWMSFDVPVDAAHPMTLLVTYNNSDFVERSFDISADGTKLKTEVIRSDAPPRFYDIAYALPADLVKGKQKVTIRFEAASPSGIAGVYGLRMIRADAER